MSKKPLQVRMDPRVLERLQRLAESRGVNVQDLIRSFTAEQLRAEEQRMLADSAATQRGVG